MLFPTLRRSPGTFNQKLYDYCLNSTYDSIKKKIGKNNEERKTNINVELVIEDSVSNPSPNNPFLPVLVFLSISSFLYYFYNSKK
jgi:hypothetical protein